MRPVTKGTIYQSKLWRIGERVNAGPSGNFAKLDGTARTLTRRIAQSAEDLCPDRPSSAKNALNRPWLHSVRKVHAK